MGEVDGAKAVSVVLRIVALGTSVAAAVMMATASQLLADDSGRVVSSSDYTALKYFVVASVISAVCVALALYLYVSVRSGAGSLAVSLLDAAAQALLFSSAGAALAVRGVVVDVTGTAAAVFSEKVGTAAAVGACAAAAVSVAALTKDAARGSFTVTSAGGGGHGGGGSACKHGC